MFYRGIRFLMFSYFHIRNKTCISTPSNINSKSLGMNQRAVSRIELSTLQHFKAKARTPRPP